MQGNSRCRCGEMPRRGRCLKRFIDMGDGNWFPPYFKIPYEWLAKKLSLRLKINTLIVGLLQTRRREECTWTDGYGISRKVTRWSVTNWWEVRRTRWLEKVAVLVCQTVLCSFVKLTVARQQPVRRGLPMWSLRFTYCSRIFLEEVDGSF